jgi:hypothetical protein
MRARQRREAIIELRDDAAAFTVPAYGNRMVCVRYDSGVFDLARRGCK